ncbi:uncharacterized protein N7483_003133 [Penicillium malachiteum]|uniref:uncharacterized protein n=1 Tax=Penicillium malachiteum TaxID=1324776 RepID=UPI002549081C|nr:uncharacterized protein N7483_003133 [Penicillium malachiteum]KAJ5728625.1 hypothetical protein N7483_003133 [Penicillium malachiteum]
MYGTQGEEQEDESLNEKEAPWENDESWGLSKMYEMKEDAQDDKNLSENEQPQSSQASTKTQHFLSDSVSRRDGMLGPFKFSWW